MTEIKMHTTIYWEVPEGRDPENYIQELSEMPKLDALAKATDFGDRNRSSTKKSCRQKSYYR